MTAAAIPQRRKYRIVLTAGGAGMVLLGALLMADQSGLVDPLALASKGCRMISKSMTAGDIDAILAGHPVHLDNPDGGYCYNPPAIASSK
ncbi:hypothetical protein IPC1147_30895 [Pseudomonas aeruginosa]|uniref:hypothetical protein n=1 Tax=Pseudomonas aeruginosa TaxID=287 RepID=UPI000FFF60E0|nr:hypothetical protein [Pseudomonas aeruginosa]MBA5106044.1 hypothetical protein [Pseudomonas aeruginosa]MDP5993434.1 hypothetical protein [Pseudomonas aeruginosa]RRS17179.1 hypothetical protein IPC1107_30530 [Pseudomonas aeruginosa]RRS19432.1 hypothetical protein IPC1147_30895 [Pseudomonas aeruginosa]HCE9175697.1 hypothetical protein [Pseudomonas aeruginosa]